MKNHGISLITLIITIIVILILAAIVIFTGLRTPDSAQFSAFVSDIDTVYVAVADAYSELKAKHAIANEYRTDEQIYIEVATSIDSGQYAAMGTDYIYLWLNSIANGSSGCINILGWKKINYEDNAVSMHSATLTVKDLLLIPSLDDTTKEELNALVFDTGNKLSENKNALKINSLPLVREHDDGWYITKDGKVFNSTGFTYNNKTYFDTSYYYDGTDVTTDHNALRAEEIAKYINGEKTGYNVILKGNNNDKTFDYTKTNYIKNTP